MDQPSADKAVKYRKQTVAQADSISFGMLEALPASIERKRAKLCNIIRSDPAGYRWRDNQVESGWRVGIRMASIKAQDVPGLQFSKTKGPGPINVRVFLFFLAKLHAVTWNS